MDNSSGARDSDRDASPGTAVGARRRPPHLRRRGALAMGALAVCTLAAANVTTGPVARPASAASLRSFESCQAVDRWFSAGAGDRIGPYGFTSASNPELAYQSSVAGADTAVARATAAVGNETTGTNVQEAGYDEADRVKTADGLLVTTDGNRLVVVDVSTGSPRLLGSLELPERHSSADLGPAGSELLILGRRVVVVTGLGGYAGYGVWTDVGIEQPTAPSTTIRVVDISEPTSPTSLGSSEIEGSFIDARLHDGSVRVVTSSTVQVDFTTPSAPNQGEDPGSARWTSAEAGATAENLRRYQRLSGADFLPHLITRDEAGTVTGRNAAVSCQSVAHPAEFSGESMLTVSTVLPAAQTAGTDPVRSRTTVTADGGNLYAGENRLYVATTRWALNGAESNTEIHAFDTSQAESTRYVASGTVPGDVLGQWAFDVHDGVLRVASTRMLPTPGLSAPDGGVSLGDTDNMVSTLLERGDTLTVAGSVAGLGKGERIQAVRWFDDAAYVVTFRQTDPLYVLDLTSATSPRLAGEVKVPGFSQYLHPVGDDRLLGVGTSGDDNGATFGLQVATFDVSVSTEPRAVDRQEFPETQSPVQYDSHAFTYLPASATAVLPMTEPGGTTGRVASLRVAADGRLSAVASLATGHCLPQRIVPVSGQGLAVLCQRWDTTEVGTTVILTDGRLEESGRLSL